MTRTILATQYPSQMLPRLLLMLSLLPLALPKNNAFLMNEAANPNATGEIPCCVPDHVAV
eukprot:COSAG02_NODE_45253_length_359_cov_0.500000_2_plen_59_part_01